MDETTHKCEYRETGIVYLTHPTTHEFRCIICGKVRDVRYKYSDSPLFSDEQLDRLSNEVRHG